MYVVTKWHKFENLEAHVFGAKVSIKLDDCDGLIGYMPIYDTLENLLKDYPDCEDYLEISLKK